MGGLDITSFSNADRHCLHSRLVQRAGCLLFWYRCSKPPGDALVYEPSRRARDEGHWWKLLHLFGTAELQSWTTHDSRWAPWIQNLPIQLTEYGLDGAWFHVIPLSPKSLASQEDVASKEAPLFQNLPGCPFYVVPLGCGFTRNLSKSCVWIWHKAVILYAILCHDMQRGLKF